MTPARRAFVDALLLERFGDLDALTLELVTTPAQRAYRPGTPEPLREIVARRRVLKDVPALPEDFERTA